MTAKQAAAEAADREIVVARLIDAPRELVFDVWTDVRHVSNWWGPVGFTTTTQHVDFRAGGQWRFVMHGPDGTDYRNEVLYLEIERPARLVYRHAGEAGGEPVSFQATISFEDQDGRTLLTLHMTFPTAAERDRVVDKYGALEGAHDTLARLAAHLAER